MDYADYFTNRTTDKITRDLIGRPLTFDNGEEKLGGYIVEAEATWENETVQLILMVAAAAQLMKACIAVAVLFTSMRKGNTSSLMLPAKRRTNHKEFNPSNSSRLGH